MTEDEMDRAGKRMVEIAAAHLAAQRAVAALVEEHGASKVLWVLGEYLKSLDGAGTAATIGRVLEALSELEW